MAKITWTDEATRWLHDIHDYISTDNPDAARKVLSGIIEKAKLLEKFPHLGYTFRMVTEGEIRIFLYGHYRIAYRVNSSTSIDILGVFHGALDIANYL